ncbi:MAG: hypothetical protein KIT69_12315, partial [Propionibacteriaceae bacterium]|nr:hypothetical protein [Propionibacteriaceae bacterium]
TCHERPPVRPVLRPRAQPSHNDLSAQRTMAGGPDVARPQTWRSSPIRLGQRGTSPSGSDELSRRARTSAIS